MKTKGVLYTAPDGNKEIIISRANHDFNTSSNGKVSVDGGQNNPYNRVVYDDKAIFEWIWFEYHNVTHADLYNDWNYRKNKFGRVKLPSKKVTILEEKDYPDTDSFEWQKQTKIWGTNGPDGDQPTKYVMLVDCSSDHLNAILHHCGHISDEIRNIIKSILIDRES